MASPGFSEVKQHTGEKVEPWRRDLQNIIKNNRTIFF